MDTTGFMTAQYELARSSRGVLLDFCGTMRTADLVRQNSSFGRGSAWNLLAHNANCYQFWLGEHGLGEQPVYLEYSPDSTLSDLRKAFETVDELVGRFIGRYGSMPQETVEMVVRGRRQVFPAIQLFTHVLTHEFHHKGQVLSLARHLGYEPVDTDMIR